MGVTARDPDVPSPTGRTLQPYPLPPAQSAGPSDDSTIRDFSLVYAGPVYSFLKKRGWINRGLPDLLRRIALVVAIAWVPLLLLSLKDGTAFGHRVAVPLLYDFATYGRLLLGLPILILAEAVIDPAIREVVGEFSDAQLVPQGEIPNFIGILQRVQRLRDSWIVELILIALACFPVFVFQHEWTATAVSNWHTTSGGLTAAGWWYAVFSTPIMRFIAYRWAFRYFLWGLLLWRIGRLNLVLMPTHPDHAAGLNFLSIAQERFALLFTALACSLAGHIATNIAFEGASLTSYKFIIVGFVVLCLIVGILPLTVLTPKLIKTRKMGVLEYGRLANTYSASFDRKWVHSAEPATESLLGTADIQSLADIGNSFSVVEEMSIFPVTKKMILQIAVLTLIPMLPVIVLGTPMAELVNAVLKTVI